MSQVVTAVSPAESEALEALFERVINAQEAFDAVQKRIAEDGQLQRLGPGSWVISRTTPESFNEQKPTRPEPSDG